MHTLQYVNDQGQYIQQAQQQQQQQFNNSHMGYENGAGQYRKENQYSSNPYLNMDQQQQQFYQDSNHYRDPYLPQEVKEPPISQQQQQQQHNQFFLHDNSGGTPPQPAQRRTWAQSAAAAATQRGGSAASSDITLDINAWNQGIKSSPYNKSPSQSGFSLHHNGDSGGLGDGSQQQRHGGSQQSFQNLFEVHHGSSAGSPQHSRVRNQISQMINHGSSNNSSPSAETRSHHDSFRDHRPMPLSPPIDDMAPQSISFIGDEDTGDIEINTSKSNSFAQRQQQQQLEQLYGSSRPGSKMQNNTSNGQELDKHLSKLNITSGNRTYRIPSPTRPTLNSNSFHVIIALYNLTKQLSN